MDKEHKKISHASVLAHLAESGSIEGTAAALNIRPASVRLIKQRAEQKVAAR